MRVSFYGKTFLPRIRRDSPRRVSFELLQGGEICSEPWAARARMRYPEAWESGMIPRKITLRQSWGPRLADLFLVAMSECSATSEESAYGLETVRRSNPGAVADEG